jgi:hypothetical protein
MQKHTSKNQRRRLRREAYYRCLEGALDEEGRFVRRVISAMDHRGLDIAPDGRPIKAGFWAFIRRRQEQARRVRKTPERRKLAASSLACLDLMERAVHAVAVKGARRSAK